MLNACAFSKIKAEFRECQTPLCESTSTIRKVKNPSECVMISAYCKTTLVRVETEEKFGPYYCQAFTLRCIVQLFDVGERSRSITDRFRRVVRLFL